MKPIKKKWYVGFILGKPSEKVLNRIRIHFPEIQIWIPKSKFLNYKGGQRVVEEVNVFDNYILIKLPQDSVELQQEIIRKTPIMNFLKSGDETCHLTEEEVVHLKNRENLIIISEYPFKKGDEVEVVKGAYEGYIGILKSKSKSKVEVEINFHNIRTSVVSLEMGDIKKVGDVGEIKIYPEGEFNIAKNR